MQHSFFLQKLSFEEIYKAVKEAKLKCTKARLMDFLDDQVSGYKIYP